MKKKASTLKKGDKVTIMGKEGIVEEIEISDSGKQGVKKCRLVINFNNEKVVFVRPEDYPFEVA